MNLHKPFLEQSMTLKQLSVVLESVHTNFKSIALQPIDNPPVDRITLRNDIPGGEKSKTLFELRDAGSIS